VAGEVLPAGGKSPENPLVCDRCGGPRQVIASITDEELAGMMLDAMKIEQDVQEMERARPVLRDYHAAAR
jgi:hypothetical protein